MGEAPSICPNLSNQTKIQENQESFKKRKPRKLKENQQNERLFYC